MTELIARSLLHFLWEGTILGLLAALLLRAMRRSLPQVRYTVACAFLLAMAVAPLLTLVFLHGAGSAPQVPMFSGGSDELLILPPVSGQQRDSWLPIVFATWLAGVAVFSLRAAGGWLWAVARLRSGRSDAAPAVQQAAARIATRLGIGRAVQVFECVTAAVPATYGAIRPVIVIPASALTGLDAMQLEAILAHELAHIARHDFLVNCLQTVVETVLFYHPAVWSLSRVIRQEREVCCDVMAAEICGDRLLYSRALLAVEELRQMPQPVLAASGGDLRRRVERLLLPNAPDRSAFLPAMIVLAAVLAGGASLTLHAQQPNPQSSPWQKWLTEDVAYIINPDEIEAFERIHTDEERKYFVEQFWTVRGGESAKEEHYRRIMYANERYSGDHPGWTTDRGRIYIAYGPPAEIESHPPERESWRYSDGRQYDFAGPDYKLQPKPRFPIARIGVDRMPAAIQPALRTLLNRYIGKPMSNELMQDIQNDARSIEPRTGFTWRTHKDTAETSVELFPSPPSAKPRGQARSTPGSVRLQVAAVPRTEAAGWKSIPAPY